MTLQTGTALGGMSEIVTLTLNPALDLSTSAERVEATHKLRCRGLRRDPGGGGINVARVVRRLGLAVTAVYTVGGPIGQLLDRLVAQEHVDSLTVPIVADTRENFTVDERASGRQFRFLLPGPALTEQEWRRCIEALESVEPFPKYLVASGSLPDGVPVDFYARIARLAKARNAKFVLDTSGEALSVALKEGVHLVKPNLRELSLLVGRPLAGEAEWAEACQALLDRGQAEVVTLTLGHQGAMLVARHQLWRSPALNIKPVSAVGAGDSFLGGLLWSLATGHDLPEALKYGMAAGSAAVLAHGTGLSEAADVAKLFHKVRVTSMAGNAGSRQA